ncbi:collagen-binding domain-containing protein [Streptomyces sp. SP18CS02]|uniref:collagen-binding domain-containing protein n=1 Tax=Streptomyces sp. SP18CS02 TaxID=3002531 RepID=UPI002E75B1D3|nr:collagen-binding domain-containing protein [Streptomyces sp. SP18CS02]MEE1754731.1 choice-of-anchor A family protein [Streptomyces sp. SP18CS02]
MSLGIAVQTVQADPAPPASERSSRTSTAVVGNPMAGNNGFGVVTEKDALLGAGESRGAVAVGGDLRFGTGFTVSPPGGGSFVAPGDSRPTALLVGGRADFAGSAAEGVLRVRGDGYVKIGDTARTPALATDMNGAAVNTRIVGSGTGYNTTPRIELTVPQPPGSVGPAPGLLDVGELFAGHRGRADLLASCSADVVARDGEGAALTDRGDLAPGSNVRVRLSEDRTNVLRLTGEQLSDIAVLTFENKPTATGPLVVVTDTGGDGLSWRTPALTGAGDAEAPYLLWAFPDAARITLTGGNTLFGSLHAPRAHLKDLSAAGIEGDVVVRSLEAGTLPASSGGAVNAGGIHHVPFAAELSCGQGATAAPSPSPSGPGASGGAESGPSAPAGSGHPDQGDEHTGRTDGGAGAQQSGSGPAAGPKPVAASGAGGPSPAAGALVSPVSRQAAPSESEALAMDRRLRVEAAGEMADTGAGVQLWLLAGVAALLVTVGTVMAAVARRRR